MARTYARDISNGNYSAAYALTTAATKAFISEQDFEQYQRRLHFTDRVEFEKLTVGQRDEDGVVINFPPKGGTTDDDNGIQLRRDGNNWRVAHTGVLGEKIQLEHDPTQIMVLSRDIIAINPSAQIYAATLTNARNLNIPVDQYSDLLADALQKYPDDPRIQFSNGFILLAARRNKEAIAALNIATHAADKLEKAQALSLLKEAFQRSGDTKGERDAEERLIKEMRNEP